LFLGRVIGNVWATKKYPPLQNMKLMFVQPINSELENIEEPIVAVDTVGAGPGEIIYYITASEAVIPLPVNMAPVDASIVGIVDSIHTEN
jgi:ethanolamine utilization protein EutN